jgi:hypothetical protein
MAFTTQSRFRENLRMRTQPCAAFRTVVVVPGGGHENDGAFALFFRDFREELRARAACP